MKLTDFNNVKQISTRTFSIHATNGGASNDSPALIPVWRGPKITAFWNREDVFSTLFFLVLQMFYAAVYSGGVVSHVHN